MKLNIFDVAGLSPELGRKSLGLPRVELSSPTIIDQNTTNTNGLGPDGFTWAQGHPIIVDKFGHLISAQNTGGSEVFDFSNDAGLTWNDGLGQLFIARGCVTYDSVNDILHVLWNATNASDGVIYRRYTISRDGSNAITAIVRDNSVNLQLDFQTAGGTVQYEHPVLIWMGDSGFGTYGAVLALWGLSQAGAAANGSEVRASMRVLTNDANDNTAGNWKAPVSASVSTITQAPAVAYTAIDVSAVADVAYPSASRKVLGAFAKDICVAYALPSGSSHTYKYRRMKWNEANLDWSTGLSTAITLSAQVRSGTDAGYSLKEQLITEPREDASLDRVVVGFCTWKNDIVGDTWGYVSIANDETFTMVDVYSSVVANNGSTIFITGDIACLYGSIIITYTDLPRKDAYVCVYNSKNILSQSPLVFFSTHPVDIPTIWQDGITTLYNGKVMVAFRDFNDEARNNPPTYSGGPYKGYIGMLEV